MERITKEKLKILYDYAFTGLDETDDLSYINPFDLMTREDRERPELFLLKMLSDPDNFHLTCKLIFNVTISLQQAIVLKELWTHPFPILLATRGWSKSFTIALYSMLRALFLQGRKIVITGAGFRQGKIVMNYMDKIWSNAPVLRDIMRNSPKVGLQRGNDRYDFFLGYSQISALPIGDGDKIRGERSNDTITDEFGAINPQIYEQVLGPFSIVASNPIEQIQKEAQLKLMKRYGIIDDASQFKLNSVPNQQIISGTPGYTFEHFYRYYTNWQKYIKSKRHPEILREVFGKEVPSGFNPDDFTIIRIPYELIPDGYIDKAQVAKSKASITSMMFDMEYACIFPKDSDGFFKASLIEKCTASPENVSVWRNVGMDINTFSARRFGDPNLKYVYAIDPASEINNFALVILELRESHNRIVHCWTANSEKHMELMRTGEVTEKDFYRYCARKIRDLMQIFPTDHIAIDAQGGGKAVVGALADDKLCLPGEESLYPIIDYDKPKDTDDLPGKHILHMIQFSKQEFTDDANHDLKHAMENKKIIFPYFDSVSIMEADESDSGLESIMWEIEELKTELKSIVVTKTPNQLRDRFDTPSTKAGGKKISSNKDRYSALLMANYIALRLDKKVYNYSTLAGGAVGNGVSNIQVIGNQPMPAWYGDVRNIGIVVRK